MRGEGSRRRVGKTSRVVGKRRVGKKERKFFPSSCADRIERGLVAARRTIFMTILTFSLSGK